MGVPDNTCPLLVNRKILKGYKKDEIGKQTYLKVLYPHHFPIWPPPLFCIVALSIFYAVFKAT